MVETPIGYCKTCNKFYNSRMKGEAIDFVRNTIVSDYKIKDLKIDCRSIGKRIIGKIHASGIIPPAKNDKVEEIKYNIGFRKNMCDDCVKLSGNYHEAVVQIRGDEKDRIYDKMVKLSRKSLIAGIDNLKEGYNIRYVYKRDAVRIISFLRKKFDIKDTYKLVGEKKGAKLYRNFYMVK